MIAVAFVLYTVIFQILTPRQTAIVRTLLTQTFYLITGILLPVLMFFLRPIFRAIKNRQMRRPLVRRFVTEVYPNGTKLTIAF